MAAILSSRQTFLLKVIPEVEYTRKVAMNIFDILSYWSTLKLKYWRRYINFKIWPILLPGDVINDVMNVYLYNCSHTLMIPMHRKVNDDIFAQFLIIMKYVIWFIKEYRGPTLRQPCDVIDDVIITKILIFGIIWDDLFISEIKLKLCLIFQNGRHFELATNFFTGSYTGSWIYQKDSH